MRIVIAGGGTGGHLFPGVAVAREILARQADAVISFAGTATGIESRVIPLEGFALDLVRSSGLKGKSLADRVRGAARLPLSVLDAWSIVTHRRPQMVIGVGGYSSGPVVLVAALRGVPTMLLEQNAVPGLTNRLLARWVRAAAVTFESTRGFFGAKAFVSGNPVRPEFFEAASTSSQGPGEAGAVNVLVFGGSQGAHAINVAMAEAASALVAGSEGLRLVHQTGERDLQMVRDAYDRAGLRAEVQPFLYDMGERLKWAEVIVCRAGSTTLAELAAVGKAAVLVPLPTATDDHQRHNAEALVASGAAELLLQRDLTGKAIAERILTLAGNPERRARIAAAARQLARPDAARLIVDRAMELIESRTLNPC